MDSPVDSARMDVLRELPPLMPQFLRKRRVGLTVVSDLLKELGLDRLHFFTLVEIDLVQGSYGKESATLPELRAYNPYVVIDSYAGALALLKDTSLICEDATGAISLSSEARAAVDRLHTEATGYLAAMRPIPHADMERLARELRRGADAIAADPVLSPRPGSHLAGYRALSRFGDQSAPLVAIEQAMSELWGARDDAHMAAWRAEDMEGPAFDLLSHIWSGATGTKALAEALKVKQTPGDIESSLTWLVEHEYIERNGEAVALTPRGIISREDTEAETDRIYFASWPHTLREAESTRDALAALVEKLGASL